MHGIEDEFSMIMSPLLQRRKKKSSFSGLVFLAIILLGASLLLWQVIYSPVGVAKKVTLEIPSGSAALVKIEGGSGFVEIPDVGTLIEGESVRATRGSGTRLTFFDETKVSLDEGTEVMLTRVREHDADESVDIVLDIISGQLWASVPKKINPESKVVITKGAVSAITSGGEISFGENTIRVLQGKALIEVEDEIYTTLEIGQEISLSESDIQTIIAGGEGPEKALVTAEFQSSDWFRTHMRQQPDEAEETSESILGEVIETASPSPQDLATVQILEPGKNDDTVTTAQDSITIVGTVPENTAKVLVNDYALTRYVPGETEFSYNAAVAWGTLAEGENEYTVVAFDDDGVRSEAQITIVYDPDATVSISPSPDASETASPAEETASPSPTSSPTTSPSATASASGGLTIDAPEDGATIDDAMIIISGKAPGNASRIVVDDYTLTAFTTGDATWQYRMSDTFDNRPVGEKTIVVEAYSATGALIASEEITITIEEAEAVSPTPTAASTTSPTSTPSENSKHMPELRDDYLPPLPQDSQGGSTI